MSRKRLVMSISGIAIALVTVVAVAPDTIAAGNTPRAGNYAQVKNHTAQLQFQVRDGRVSNIVRLDNCVLVPIRIPSLEVVNGRFSYTGVPLDYLNHEWRVRVEGRFVSRTQATGHWSARQLTHGNCSSSYAFAVKHQ